MQKCYEVPNQTLFEELPNQDSGLIPIKNLDQNDQLVILSKKIDWHTLEQKLLAFFDDSLGRPALPIRLMCSLVILKHIFNHSDRELLEAWKRSKYYQAFSGKVFECDEEPCDESTLSRFRLRIGVEGCEIIFQASIKIHGEKGLEPEQIIDTTVQAKYTTYPNDISLAIAVIIIIWRFAHRLDISFRKKCSNRVKKLKSKARFNKGKNRNKIRETVLIELREIAITLLDELIDKLPDYLLNDPNMQTLLDNWRRAVT
jgi:IS5 family transposase